VLGFENCCDGHAELEIHLPCDGKDSAWRVVTSGTDSECMKCSDSDVPATCSSTEISAACCGNSGGHTMCQIPKEGTTCDDHDFVDEAVAGVDQATAVGRFIAIGQAMNYPDAKAFCEEHFFGMASIHSPSENFNAMEACATYAGSKDFPLNAGSETQDTDPVACWIGLNDEATEGQFVWSNGQRVDFVQWAASEPNDDWWVCGDEGQSGFGQGVDRSHCGADSTTIGSANANWNDLPGDASYADAGHQADMASFTMQFPLCATEQPRPSTNPQAQMMWGAGVKSSFNIKVCVDHSDTVFFQDVSITTCPLFKKPVLICDTLLRLTYLAAMQDRLWIAYGGQYAAAGGHGDCPERYQGKAYVNEQARTGERHPMRRCLASTYVSIRRLS
jgi:hypothetical protein